MDLVSTRPPGHPALNGYSDTNKRAAVDALGLDATEIPRRRRVGQVDRHKLGENSGASKRRRTSSVKASASINLASTRPKRPAPQQPQHQQHKQQQQQQQQQYIDDRGRRIARDEEYYSSRFPDILSHETSASPQSHQHQQQSRSQSDKIKKSSKSTGTTNRPGSNNPLVLQSFFKNFLADDLGSFKSHIDLPQHQLDSKTPVTDATLHELADIHPGVLGINASHCDSITDVGLWAIAKTCVDLTHINLSFCTKVTQVGLRSMSMRCSDLTHLDLSFCPSVDDMGIRLIAVGCCKLQAVNLRGCKLVTDVGVAELARCCPNLTDINLYGLERLSEFGDKALVEIGNNCRKLSALNLTHCAYVQDSGIRALAKGCPLMRSLILCGCIEITGVSIRAIAKGLHAHLVELRVDYCPKLKNPDVWTLAEALGETLRTLHLSGLKKLSIQGLRGLCEWATQLKSLSLSTCPKMNDDMLTMLGQGLPELRYLNIQNAKSVTIRGVQAVCDGCTKLTTVELSKCKYISRADLAALAEQLPFVSLAPDRLALLPVPEADELIKQTEQLRLDTCAAIKIQKMFRGAKARGGIFLLRFHAQKRYVVPKFQGLVRAHLCRKNLHRLEQLRLQHIAAGVIQRVFRSFKGRAITRAIHDAREHKKRKGIAANDGQRVFRGWVGRMRVASMRRNLAIQALLDREEHVQRVQMALRIQRTWRGDRGHRIYQHLLRDKRERAAQALKELVAAITIQGFVRAVNARQLHRLMVEHKMQVAAELRAARFLQRAYRGYRARFRFQALLIKQQWQLEERCAMLMQKCWRGARGRHLTAIYRGIVKLRVREHRAATCMQSWWRAQQSRSMMDFVRMSREAKQKKLDSSIMIQKLFRGHKGREEWEVQTEIKKLHAETRELRDRAHVLEQTRSDTQTELTEKNVWIKASEVKIEAMQSEHDEVVQHRAKWYDSANVSGTMQRYQTSYLVNALQMQLEELRAKVMREQRTVEELTAVLRHAEKDLRSIAKELEPKEKHTTKNTRMGRAKRLRAKCRQRETGCVSFQRVWRGHRVRAAARRGGMYWTECFDEESQSTYYYNAQTQESTYERPHDMMLLLDHPLEVSASGWVEALDETSGHMYYYNTNTGEYRWEPPDEDAVEHTNSWFTDQDMQLATARDKQLRQTSQWAEYEAEDGSGVYYYNHTTDEAQWDKPGDFDQAALQDTDMGALTARSTALRTGRSWKEMQDEENGVTFYYNQKTGESQWDKPSGFDQEWLDANRTVLTARSLRTRDIAADWDELFDPETETTFYYNRETGESRWSLPPQEPTTTGRVGGGELTARFPQTGRPIDEEEEEEEVEEDEEEEEQQQQEQEQEQEQDNNKGNESEVSKGFPNDSKRTEGGCEVLDEYGDSSIKSSSSIKGARLVNKTEERSLQASELEAESGGAGRKQANSEEVSGEEDEEEDEEEKEAEQNDQADADADAVVEEENGSQITGQEEKYQAQNEHVQDDEVVIDIEQLEKDSENANGSRATDERWREYHDEQGNAFHTFHHQQNNCGKEALQRAELEDTELDVLTSRSISVMPASLSGWQQLFDPVTGLIYYWNEQTGETSWDPEADAAGNYADGQYGEADYDRDNAGQERTYIDTSGMGPREVLRVFEDSLSFNPVLRNKLEQIRDLMEEMNLSLVDANRDELDGETEKVLDKVTEQFAWLSDAIQDASLLTAETIADKITTVLLKHGKAYQTHRFGA